MSQKIINLDQDPIRSSFLTYLLPAITGMIIKSVYIMADTIFIGRGVGPDGLGAVAMTFPFYSFFAAIAMMIGIGGGALFSIQLGKGDKKAGQGYFIQSMVFTAVFAGGLSLLSLFWLEDILRYIGAEGNMAVLSYDYLSIMLKFFTVFALAWVLSCFVRNDTNPKLVMYAMSGSAIINILLDYLFIFEFGWGIKGAAYGTGLSQVILLGILMLHFVSGRGQLKLNLQGLGIDRISRILSMGLPTFFIESGTAASALLFNIVLFRFGGDIYVSAYSIVMNVGLLVLFILMGIGQACQPIISFIMAQAGL